MPLKRRMALLDWAEEAENRYIIEDDYDSEFRYRGKPIPALQGFDRGGRVIYMGTFSKSIAPSIRVSYMVLPEFLAEQYAERKSPFSVTVSRADQKILELFLKEGGYERHLNRMRAVYKSKHDKMVKVLRDMGDICTFFGRICGTSSGTGIHKRADRRGGSFAGRSGRCSGLRILGIRHRKQQDKKRTGKKGTSGLCLHDRRRNRKSHEEIERGLGISIDRKL